MANRPFVMMPVYLTDEAANVSTGLAMKARLMEVFHHFLASALYEGAYEEDQGHYRMMFADLQAIIDEAMKQQAGIKPAQAESSSSSFDQAKPEVEPINPNNGDYWLDRIGKLQQEKQALIDDLFSTDSAGGWVEVINDLFQQWEREQGKDAAEPYRSRVVHRALHLPAFIAKLGDIERDIELFIERMKGGAQS